MQLFVSFVRGINVGGNRKLPMESLRKLYESIGLSKPRTLLQSGNVVFYAQPTERLVLEQRIASAIGETVGFRPEVLVRTPAELKAVVDRNPFPDEAKGDPSHLLVMFLKERPDRIALDNVEAIDVGPELIKAGEEELYLYYPAGIGRSKLTNALIEKRLGTSGTARNWTTVTKLIGLAASHAAP